MSPLRPLSPQVGVPGSEGSPGKKWHSQIGTRSLNFLLGGAKLPFLVFRGEEVIFQGCLEEFRGHSFSGMWQGMGLCSSTAGMREWKTRFPSLCLAYQGRAKTSAHTVGISAPSPSPFSPWASPAPSVLPSPGRSTRDRYYLTAPGRENSRAFLLGAADCLGGTCGLGPRQVQPSGFAGFQLNWSPRLGGAELGTTRTKMCIQGSCVLFTTTSLTPMAVPGTW